MSNTDERTPNPSVQQAHPAPTDPKGLADLIEQAMFETVNSPTHEIDHFDIGRVFNAGKVGREIAVRLSHKLEPVLAHQRQSIVAEIRKGMPAIPTMIVSDSPDACDGMDRTWGKTEGFIEALSEVDALLSKVEQL